MPGKELDKKKTQDKAGEHSDEQARVQDHKRSCMYWKQAWSQVTAGDFAVESRKFGRRNCKRETILQDGKKTPTNEPTKKKKKTKQDSQQNCGQEFHKIKI